MLTEFKDKDELAAFNTALEAPWDDGTHRTPVRKAQASTGTDELMRIMAATR